MNSQGQMKRAVCATLCLFWFALCANGQIQKQKRPVTVADLITMATNAVSGNTITLGVPAFDGLTHLSPDGKAFVVVIRKGNIERNTNDYSILLWQTDEIRHSTHVSPTFLLTMSSGSNRPGIKDIVWLGDNKRLAFIGEQPDGLPQVYTLDIHTRTLRRLTDHSNGVLAFSISSEGNRVAYIANEAPKVRSSGAMVITDQVLPDLVSGKQPLGNHHLFIQDGPGQSRAISLPALDPRELMPPQLSPDGLFLVIPTRVANFPDSWKAYADSLIQNQAKVEVAPGQYYDIFQYTLVNTTTGEPQILLNSPIFYFGSSVVWLNERSVILSGVYLPLTGITDSESGIRRSAVFSVEMEVPSGTLKEIVQVNSGDKDVQSGLTLLGWDANLKQLVFRQESATADVSKSSAKRVFQRIGHNWKEVNEQVGTDVLGSFSYEQDMNTPPRIVFHDPASKRSTLLFDLNPQFKDLDLPKVEEITWRSSEGITNKGGLFYPRGYRSGTKYPLVIQGHGWNRRWFGDIFTSGYAALPLAASGIMVLQMGENAGYGLEWNTANTATPTELSAGLLDYEGAIDHLKAAGFIDPNRLGILGFSRTCIHVKNALIHSKYKFAAASVTDGIDGGYLQYIEHVNSNAELVREYENMNEGVPFGVGLKKWLEKSPGFSIDKVTTPIRIMALNSNWSLLQEWEWFAALTRLKKPVELILLQDASHILEKPGDRLISQQGNVDWFRFWLKDEVNRDASNLDQYDRWDRLKSLRH